MEDSIENIDAREYELRFTLTNSSIAMANALRRIMISEIPTLAIDKIIVEKNDSNIPEEIIAHRLGLIPIYGDLNHLEFSDNCPCESECPRCTIRFTCDLTADTDRFAITSDHLLPDEPWNRSSFSPVRFQIGGKFYPIVLFRLDRGERIKIEAHAKMGIGKNHAKFSPIAIATYDYSDNEDTFFFQVESNGSYDPLEILKKSLSILEEKMNKLNHISI